MQFIAIAVDSFTVGKSIAIAVNSLTVDMSIDMSIDIDEIFMIRTLNST